jgi:hypothetical protein
MTANRDWLRPAPAEEAKRTIDLTVAHIARVQDYWLGGKDQRTRPEVDDVGRRRLQVLAAYDGAMCQFSRREV